MFALTLAVPAYRGMVNVGHLPQVAELSRALQAQMVICWTDTCSLDWARNINVHTAMHRKPSRWLLMVDADTYHWNARDTLLMLDAGEKRQTAIIGAPVQTRSKNRAYNICTADERNLESAEFLGRVVSVDRIGTAFLAVNLDWLRTNWATGPWFQSVQVDRGIESPGWIGEDYAFCDGIRRRGGMILCDGRFEPTHAGVSDAAAMAPH